MNISNTVISINNFLTNEQIKNALDAFKISKKKEKFSDRLVVNGFEIKDCGDIIEKFKNLLSLKLHWWQVVKCPINSSFNKHKDISDDTTIASCIIFLNDDFSGGSLIFTDGLKINAQKGRAVFFDGINLEHEVNKNSLKERYVIAGWFRK
tara:strand:- start:342 stop:794 length:453 start_codon:yes stop_codon:yes gene_type:complete